MVTPMMLIMAVVAAAIIMPATYRLVCYANGPSRTAAQAAGAYALIIVVTLSTIGCTGYIALTHP